MLMLKIHIQYIFNMLCSMFLLSVLELVAAPARTQLAMTFLECLSSSSVTLNLLHMHIQYLKTSKLQNYGFNVVMQQQQYMYVMYVFYMFLLWFFFSVSGRQNKRMLLLFMGCSGNVVVFFVQWKRALIAWKYIFFFYIHILYKHSLCFYSRASNYNYLVFFLS